MLYEMPTFSTLKEALNALYEIVDAVIALDANATMKGYRKQKAKRRLNGYMSQFTQQCAANGRRCPEKSKEREGWRKLANKMKEESEKILEVREKAREELEWC